MAVTVTFYAKTATWNSITFDKSTNGLIEGTYEHEGEPLEDRTGDDEYNTFLAIVNKRCRITLRCRDVKQTSALGTKSTLALTLTTKTSTVVCTFANAVLVSARGSQARATVGDCELVFQVESADGTTVPIA